ncbi:hypothetical protein BDZ94DRAFT_1256373 [Collybia nuda]|uniref:Uncharacterized protein n=1 Tax=Collybia nuda TaxID=64659 RepID=A0A9P6CL51_9AGAR|nr:hypothetical protein BDZ94DRAFT_1256373 [Collybia nuda]
MSTSELSNALNPYANQPRPRPEIAAYSTEPVPVAQQQHHYVPHRSELELAVSEPLATAPVVIRPKQPTSGSVQAVQELLRIVAVTRESQEIERKRRLAWEQEQEAKFTQRQAEMERQMFELRQEISKLRSASLHPASTSGLLTPQYSNSPALAVQRPPQLASPVSPISHSSSYSHPMFLQGSSTQPIQSHLAPHDQQQQQFEQSTPVVEPTFPSVTPAPSPHLSYAHSSQPHETLASSANLRKRPSSQLTSDEEEGGNSSDSSLSNHGRPIRRRSGHDKRCLTIHHALRAHILRLMGLETDKNLPDSHKEGVPIGPHDPVRFVWDKTAKQSAHNFRMKARVLADIKSHRKQYKHVPDKDFGKKTLDTAFDQTFVTFRQKFKAQRDIVFAEANKRREDAKAQKARHLSRRKTKLSNRAEARMKNPQFEHVIFDGALQLECMSSDESDFGDEVGSSIRSSGILRTRGCLWRSKRLVTFFGILDDEERTEASSKPKRGGKRERLSGPPKDGFHLPPEGVASWMISRRWVKASHARFPDFPDTLMRLVQDPPGFDWDHFDFLGEESEDSADESQTYNNHGLQQNSVVHHTSTSSLNFALI